MIRHRPLPRPSSIFVIVAAWLCGWLPAPGAVHAQAAPDARDPRVELAILQLTGQHRAALARTEALLASARAGDAALDVSALTFLRGELLLRSGRADDANQAFAAVLGADDTLAPYARLRLADAQRDRGNPEVAAGLAASVLAAPPNRVLGARAARLMRQTLDDGGDCRLLAGTSARPLGTLGRREWTLARAICALREGRVADAESSLINLITDNRGDSVGRLAAERLRQRDADDRSVRAQALIGLTFHDHREFDLAIQSLSRAWLSARRGDGDLRPSERFDVRYALARSHFWESRYPTAAAIFAELARTGGLDAGRVAQVRYQQGRSLELDGRWPEAIDAFDAAARAQPRGSWAGAARISALRLRWLQGQEDDALRALDGLRGQRNRGNLGRALIFLASSDLARQRTDRAGAWLAEAGRTGAIPTNELAYWRGRRESLLGQTASALDHYLRVLRADPFHPFADAARRRLAEPDLIIDARKLGRRLMASERADDLYGAWLLLGPRDGAQAGEALRQRLRRDSVARAVLDWRAAEPTAWPLWQRGRVRSASERLLAVGLWRDGAAAMTEHFPLAEPALALAGGQLLARGGAYRRSVYVAEVLAKRLPRRVPQALQPPAFRQLLYPLGYSHLLMREGQRQGVDPLLIAAIVREESRFDPEAFSGAAARGLTQFIFPTARSVAAQLDPAVFLGLVGAAPAPSAAAVRGADAPAAAQGGVIGAAPAARRGPGPRIAPAQPLGSDAPSLALRPADLDRPAVAIALGAAYLRRLSDDFDGVTPHMIAAYNAGEPQAALWARYCFSDDPAEFYSKVTFRETRNYVRKVLRSYAHYRDLYGADLPANLSADGAPAAAQPPPSTPTPARSAPNGR